MSESSKKNPESVFDAMPPRFAFWAGIVSATAVIAIIGFVVMLAIVFQGDASSNSKTTSKNTGDSAAVAAADAGAGAAPEVAAGPDSIDLELLRNVRGEGDITIVEFSDTECPFCARFHDTMKQVVDEYDGQVQWAYNHFPLTSIHPKAPRQAEATECAGEQGAFWEYTDAIFEDQAGLTDDGLIALAGELGLNESEFETCLQNDTFADLVTSDTRAAQALGGTGTPYSLIVDADGNVLQQIPGALPFASVSAALDQVLN